MPYPHGARTFVRDAENGSGEEQGGGRRRRRRRGAPQGPQGPTQWTWQAARTPLHWAGDAGPAGPHPAAAAQKRGGCGGGSSGGSKLCFLGTRAERRRVAAPSFMPPPPRLRLFWRCTDGGGPHGSLGIDGPCGPRGRDRSIDPYWWLLICASDVAGLAGAAATGPKIQPRNNSVKIGRSAPLMMGSCPAQLVLGNSLWLPCAKLRTARIKI